MTISIFENSIISDFSDLHPEACLEIGFQQKMRIPQKEQMEQNIPRFGMLPIDYAGDNYKNLPIECSIHDIIIPLYQSEALSIHFHSNYMSERKVEYPFAIKADLEDVNCINGQKVINSLCKRPKNYFTTLEQDELSGFFYNNNFNQFIATPLAHIQSNSNMLQNDMNIYSIYIEVMPLKLEKFEARCPVGNLQEYQKFHDNECSLGYIMKQIEKENPKIDDEFDFDNDDDIDEEFSITDWDRTSSKTYTIHIINTYFWEKYLFDKLTFHEPLRYKDYIHINIPWFDCYSEEYIYCIGH